MRVDLKDSRLADAPSKMIAKQIVKTPSLKIEEGKQLMYKIELNGKLSDLTRYTVSAVINMGWCADENGSEWLRKGDFLNDTMFPVQLNDCQNDICKGPMVSVKKYDV